MQEGIPDKKVGKKQCNSEKYKYIALIWLTWIRHCDMLDMLGRCKPPVF